MSDHDFARLYEALFGAGPRPDAKTRKKALRRLVFSEDGLTLMKHLSPCLQARSGAFSAAPLEYLEGRRSVLMEIIKIATTEEDDNG